LLSVNEANERVTRREKNLYISHKKGDERSSVVLTPVRQSRYSASSVSRAWMVCWCDRTLFRVRVFLCGLLVLVLVLVLPSESRFFAAANAGFPLGRFFVEVLPIGVRLVV
jgi:hypothetical protein